MTGPTQHPASNSEARKRLAAKSAPHHDPAVCELIARAWDEGHAASYLYPEPPNPYRSAL